MVEKKHLTQMIKQQTELLSQLHEENKKLKEFVETVANGDGADANALQYMVHSYIHSAKQLLGKQE